jgi:hypothetical protein
VPGLPDQGILFPQSGAEEAEDPGQVVGFDVGQELKDLQQAPLAACGAIRIERLAAEED